MGRRYPGSLVARVLVNRLYALQKKYSKPSTKPGRWDAAKGWYLRWEGLLVGGVFVGGLCVAALRLYLNERLDDIDRRVERRTLYDGSCLMLRGHIASMQESLVFYQALVQAAHAHRSVHQQWQQTHQEQEQQTHQTLALWADRCRRVCGAGTALHASGCEPAAAAAAGQQREHAGARPQPGLQETGVQGQQSQPQPQPQQPQVQQPPPQQPQQPQVAPAHRWNVPCQLCRWRLQQLEAQLRQRQQELALVTAGHQLWQHMDRLATRQRGLLWLQYARQQQLLRSYEAQRAVWAKLAPHTEAVALGFELPSISSLASGLASRSSSAGSNASALPDTAGAAGNAVNDSQQQLQQQPQQRQQQQQPQQRQGGVRCVRHVSIRVLLPQWIPEAVDERDFDLLSRDYVDTIEEADQAADQAGAAQQQQKQQEQPPPQAPDTAAEGAGTAAAAAAAGAGSPGPAPAVAPGGPRSGAAAGAGAGAGDDSDEIELDGGGLLGEVLEEALDVVETLWQAAE